MTRDRPHTRRLLDEVDLRLGYAGCPEYWSHVCLPRRASSEQLSQWRALPVGERTRIEAQYHRLHAAVRHEVSREHERRQRIRNGIRSASITIAISGVLAAGHLTGSVSGAGGSYGDAGFPAVQWLTAMILTAALYGSACKLGERWLDISDHQEFGLRP